MEEIAPVGRLFFPSMSSLFTLGHSCPKLCPTGAGFLPPFIHIGNQSLISAATSPKTRNQKKTHIAYIADLQANTVPFLWLIPCSPKNPQDDHERKISLANLVGGDWLPSIRFSQKFMGNF